MRYLYRALKILLPVLFLAFAIASVVEADNRFEPIATGSMSEGDAVLELTPELKGDGRLIVKFAANTHTVDLSQFDLKKITVLEVNGQKIKPLKSDRLRGHHAYGKIVFDVGVDTKTFKIIVRGIPADTERVYEWR